ncbi:MAG TPA: UDP-2,3-diacylglucosamine diphosphatase LpxI [Kaistia sp.]|nr:UDP-2,3-diacylglucosamine diphosphatase LpxI [Kaistia sp.]
MAVVPAASLTDITEAPLGIICGGGAFPFAVAESAVRDGRKVVLLPLRGYADPEAVARAGLPTEWLGLGAVGAAIATLRRHGCRQVVMLGYVFRPRLLSLRPDWTMLRVLPRFIAALRGGDDHLLSRVGRFFEEQGFHLVGAHEIAPDLLLPAGQLGRVAMRPADAEDAQMGLDLVRMLGPFDVGQGVVVAQRHVQAVEAAEGTDLMLERCGHLRAIGRVRLPARTGVLVKAPKPGQDRRLDLPSLGLKTIEGAAAAGLAGIAVEAGGVIAVDVAAMIRLADEKGLFIVGLGS